MLGEFRAHIALLANSIFGVMIVYVQSNSSREDLISFWESYMNKIRKSIFSLCEEVRRK